ncbi:MAG: type II pantothenate kinase [Clostridia bacterium]|nr:type II pantothenate kinase [Clostridia bacterium]
MKTVIGIDVGGTTTKIVGFRYENKKKPTLIEPQFVRATDPVTSTYGAFGRFTMENDIELDKIDRAMITGAGASAIEKPIYTVDLQKVSEFDCIGRGGLYLSGLDKAIVVSMGTGTAIVYAEKGNDDIRTEYLGGTGVGGGTMIGLTRRILGVDNVEHIEQLSREGNLDNVDLRIKDIAGKQYGEMDATLTASNFGKLSDLATNNDIALGIVNMVSETVGMMAVFAARGFGVSDIVLTGNLTTISAVRERILSMNESFDVNFIIPEMAQYATVIGAGLNGLK